MSIRQFRPMLYVLTLLGMCSFALAASSFGLLALSLFGVGLNWWLINSGKFRPLPRYAANLITLACAASIVFELRASSLTVIFVVGQFLILLQLVKLFEQRSNRDYAQVIVLSLLLVVAAAISTSQLLFGLLLIAYLFLGLYVCLLFHLKVETDHARAALSVPEDKLNLASLRKDQRYLGRSMRKLTGLIAVAAVATAVVVFLFFPRGSGGLLLQFQVAPGTAMTGFGDQVNFQSVAQITQNNDVVAYVKLWHNDVEVTGPMTLMLRGLTHTHYNGGAGNSWSWTRELSDVVDFDLSAGRVTNLGPARLPPDVWKQQVTLEPTGTNVVFALPGPVAISVPRDVGRVRFTPQDEVLQTVDLQQQRLEYTVYSRGDLRFAPGQRRGLVNRLRSMFSTNPDPRAAVRGVFSDERVISSEARREFNRRIREFAVKPEVSGEDAKGPFARQRNPLESEPTGLDVRIARSIETYLRTNFSYTLDLTEARSLKPDQDPMVGFLYDFKKGHCEYFAGAMTLLCQSLGLDARMVVGFKSIDGYNTVGNYYVIRQSDAHAWVEVRTPDGWESFDPTSSTEATDVPPVTTWGRIKSFFNYLEFTWANSVVAYDRDSRDNVIRNLDVRLVNTANMSMAKFSQWRREGGSWLKTSFTHANFLWFSSYLLSALIWIMILGGLVLIGWFIYDRRKLRKRARRIGLENMAAPDALRLARQLGFYDELTQLLERHRICRPAHLTPMEFSNSITFLPNEAYDSVRRLTRLFYRIRYGETRIKSSQIRRLRQQIGMISSVLDQRPPPAQTI